MMNKMKTHSFQRSESKNSENSVYFVHPIKAFNFTLRPPVTPPWHRVGASKYELDLNLKSKRHSEPREVAVNTFDLQFA